MPLLKVTDREGLEHEVQSESGYALMEVLRDRDLGVAALCGGMCSCATCHVYIALEWVDKLPAVQSDEADVIKELAARQVNSRLSCQILLKPEYEGLSVTIAPEE